MRESLQGLFGYDGVDPSKRVGEGVLSPNEPAPPRITRGDGTPLDISWLTGVYDRMTPERMQSVRKFFKGYDKPNALAEVQRQATYERWSKKDVPTEPERILGLTANHVIIDELARNEKFEAFRKQVATDLDDYAKPHPLADKTLTLQGGEMVWVAPADDCPFGPCDTGVTITTSSANTMADTVCWDYAISGNGSDCTAITYHDSDRWRPGVEPRLIAVGSLEAMAKRFKMGEGMSVTLRPDGQYELTE